MLSQRRIVSLVNLLALQGTLLCVGHAAARVAHGPAPPVLVRGADARAQGRVLPWMLHRLIRRLEVYWDTEPLLNMPGHDAGRPRAGGVRLRAGAADRGARQHRDAQRARHRGGGDAARVHDDDHAAQGDVAGGRLPVDGERPVLRRRSAPPTACRWWSSSASRSTCWSRCWCSASSSSRSASSSTASTCTTSNRSRRTVVEFVVLLATAARRVGAARAVGARALGAPRSTSR